MCVCVCGRCKITSCFLMLRAPQDTRFICVVLGVWVQCFPSPIKKHFFSAVLVWGSTPTPVRLFYLTLVLVLFFEIPHLSHLLVLFKYLCTSFYVTICNVAMSPRIKSQSTKIAGLWRLIISTSCHFKPLLTKLLPFWLWKPRFKHHKQ